MIEEVNFMRVSVIRNGSIRDFIFPNEAKGSYWIDGFDINGNKRNIILIDSDNGKWKLVSNNNAYVVTITSQDNLSGISYHQYKYPSSTTNSWNKYDNSGKFSR